MDETAERIARAMADRSGLLWDVLPDAHDAVCGHGMPEGCKDYWRGMARAAIEASQGAGGQWRYYRKGVIVPITEDEARHIFDNWGVLSDDRGAATLMIEQLWSEIDRLRLTQQGNEAMTTIPICCVTGRIAGDAFACGDCDPCGAAYAVPDVVKYLLKERDEWAGKYEAAMIELDELRPAPQPDGFDLAR